MTATGRTVPAPGRSRRRVLLGLLLATLLIAGGVSYLASASPDGLDAATLRGCSVVVRDGAEELTGDCIARSARDHTMSGSPLADYTVGGAGGSGGLAGIIGAAVTLALAVGVFRALARHQR